MKSKKVQDPTKQNKRVIRELKKINKQLKEKEITRQEWHRKRDEILKEQEVQTK